MSWEYDKGIIIFLLVMAVFIVFCAFMAVRSAKKQKGKTKEELLQGQKDRNSVFDLGFIIFMCVVWLASAVLILVLYQSGNLNDSFTIPRIMSLPYDIFGIVGGAVVQIVLSIVAIILLIRAIKKRKQKRA